MILRLGRSNHADEVEAFLAALDEPAAMCGIDGAVLAANEAWRALCGASRKLPAGVGMFGAFNDARREGRGAAALRVGAGERPVTIASLGAQRFLLRLAAPAAEPAAPADAERTQALDAFAATSPFGAALIEGEDPFAGDIIEVNSALAVIAGDAARPGARLADLLDAKSAEEARASHAGGRMGPFEVRLATAPARTAHLHLSMSGRRVVAYLQDVTEQKRMQAQLAQRNKMESIGQLAGGVAHDFNNLLSAIRLRAQELLARHPLGDPSYDSLAEIRQTVDRAAELVRQLLTFSRKATTQRETLDLGEALTNFEVLLRRMLRENVELNIDYGRGLPTVRIDRSHLETAVINLVVNARDAVQANGGGAVRVRAARLTHAEATALGYGGLPMGEMALIEVVDDGPGIEPGVLASIFEPFFTTKPLGEGTGLGLATVYGIVKQADGWISVASTLGHGAAFRIFLPIYTPPLVLEPPPAPRPRPTPRDLSGAGRILFVEDEPLVRGVAARLLRARGYEVIEAADGEAALALAKDHAGSIDLMISDVIMPGMDGPALLREARPWLGAAPVIFISGYAEAEFSDLLEGESGVSFLPKPLDIMTLAERVKAQLRAPERAT